MGLKDIHGTTLDEQWKKAAYTYLGTTVADYPNMFHLYGPQGPTLLSNGPTTVEVQGRWIGDVIRLMERDGIKYINPTQEAQAEYKKKINHLSDITLFPTTKSTYVALNSVSCRALTDPFVTVIWVAASQTRHLSRRTMLAAFTTTVR